MRPEMLKARRLTWPLYFHYSGNMEMTQAVDALGALAQQTRLKIYRLLVEAGPRGLPAGRIGEQLDLAPATLSFHLSHLARRIGEEPPGRPLRDLQRRFSEHERARRLPHRELLWRSCVRSRKQIFP